MAYRVRAQIQPQAETLALTQAHGWQAEPAPCPGDASGSGQDGGLLWEGKHSPVRAAEHVGAGSPTHLQAGPLPPQCSQDEPMVREVHTMAGETPAPQCCLHDRQKASSSGSSPMRGPGAQNHTGADKLPPSYSASCHLTGPCTPIPPTAMSSFCSYLLSHAPDLVSKIPVHPPPKATAHEAQDLLPSPAAHSPLKCMSSNSLALRMHFTCFQPLDPKHPPHLPLLWHDCAGVHGAHQHPHGPSTSSRAATGTVKAEGSGQPCPLLQHPSWQHTDTCPASSSGLQDTSPRAQCSQHPITTAGQVLGDPPPFTQPNPRAA